MSEIILETKSLIMRFVKKEDTKFLYEKIFSDEKVMHFTFGKTLSYENTKDVIANRFAKESNPIGFAPLVNKETNQLVGIGGVY